MKDEVLAILDQWLGDTQKLIVGIWLLDFVVLTTALNDLLGRDY